MKRRGKKITMVTAYSYPTALHVDLADIDMVLVGDSVGMVELGYQTTQPVTMQEMLHHAKAVRRGITRSVMVVDLPFGSYEVSDQQALESAHVFVKECGADAVKLEGGKDRASSVRKIVQGGVAVMGHIGLTPQAISVTGGFRAQGRTGVKARKLLDDALALQDAGAFAIVLECIPAPVGKVISESLEIPTIGIGAGPHTSGQVLVFHDMLGMTTHPHHEQFVPSFCRKYATVGDTIRRGLDDFKAHVEAGEFPSEEYSPYKMSAEEEAVFMQLVSADASRRKHELEETSMRLKQSDEYETTHLYGDLPGQK